MTFRTYCKQLWKRQKGAVSPFLFGMLAGVAIFSAGVRAQAKIETQRIMEEQEERAAETARAYQRAVEGALMAETSGTFGILTRERLNQYVSKSIGGGTRTGASIRWGDINKDALLNSQRIILTTSDDEFVRDQVSDLEAAGIANDIATDSITSRQDVVTIDTSNIRQKQIQLTLKNMQKQADILYGFWAENSRFPNAAEYTTIQAQTGLLSFWGDPITCVSCNGDNDAELRTVTPWGATLALGVNM